MLRDLFRKTGRLFERYVDTARGVVLPGTGLVLAVDAVRHLAGAHLADAVGKA
ncbi:MAG: hypothetical protein ACR2JU_07030 [Nocardioidaceae bacterium]